MAKKVSNTTDVGKKEVKKEEPVEVKKAHGLVRGCYKLNVRNKPNPDAEVKCTIDVLTKVVIDLNKSTKEWYKIETEDGSIKGYCMKQFINI